MPSAEQGERLLGHERRLFVRQEVAALDLAHAHVVGVLLEPAYPLRPNDRVAVPVDEDGRDREPHVAVAAAQDRVELAQQERPVDRDGRGRATRLAPALDVGSAHVLGERRAGSAGEHQIDERCPLHDLAADDRARDHELVARAEERLERLDGPAVPADPRMDDREREETLHARRLAQRHRNPAKPPQSCPTSLKRSTPSSSSAASTSLASCSFS